MKSTGRASLAPGTGGLESCSSCGTIIYSDDLFCPCCGRFIAKQRPDNAERCGGCGAARRHPVQFFCTRCGVPVSEVQNRDVGR
ncbi:MAG: hypothetical protein ABI876_03070 [Bacteroidota bacterium]